MSRVFVIGVTGATGSRVARELLERGDQVVGLHRRVEQAETLRRQRVEPLHGDLTTISVLQLADAMKGAGAVVFAAGASEDGNNVADAVDGHGMALATGAVIVRPRTLTNAPGTGRVRLGLAIPYGEVPRDDLAEVLAELVHRRIRHVILELTAGDMPIGRALDGVLPGA